MYLWKREKIQEVLWGIASSPVLWGGYNEFERQWVPRGSPGASDGRGSGEYSPRIVWGGM